MRDYTKPKWASWQFKFAYITDYMLGAVVGRHGAALFIGKMVFTFGDRELTLAS